MDYFEAALLLSKRSGTGAAARDQGACAFLEKIRLFKLHEYKW
ncbi:hypothetical protein [Anaerobacillus alkalidiazotrophicus]|nr:hypothetical protein [Anaerobacillus alkalidiazotrophicus]